MNPANWGAYAESGLAQPLKIVIQCGATSRRTGMPCTLMPVLGRTRCNQHGGASTGPRTPQGREAVRANGKKGGRPRIHPLPAPKEVQAPMAAKAQTTAPPQPLVKCCDCALVSVTGSMCLAGPDKASAVGKGVRLDRCVPRVCAAFQAMGDVWG